MWRHGKEELTLIKNVLDSVLWRAIIFATTGHGTWTWDYDTENCQWLNGQYEPTFDPDTKLSGVIYDAETMISGKWNCMP